MTQDKWAKESKIKKKQ